MNLWWLLTVKVTANYPVVEVEERFSVYVQE
jgi:hypothetical protein